MIDGDVDSSTRGISVVPRPFGESRSPEESIIERQIPPPGLPYDCHPMTVRTLAGPRICQQRLASGSKILEPIALRNCRPRKLGLPRYVDR